MKTVESKKLKLNVTNIRSSLFSYNKQSKKIRSDRKSLFSKEESENKKNEKENKIESPMGKIKSLGSNIKKGLIAGPMSIFDKIKEFLTVIVIGLLVNNLPKIIDGLKKFFGDNPWILDAVTWTIKTIGKGILGFIDLVNNFSKFAGGTYATISKATQDVKKEIDGLGKLYNNAEKEVKDLITTWTLFFNPKQKPSAKAAQSYARSKGKYYSSTTKKTYTSYAAALKDPQVKRGAQQQSTSIQQKSQKAQAAPAPGYDPNKGTTNLGNKQTGYTPQILAPLTTNGKTTMGAMEPGKPNTWTRLGKDANLNPSIQRYNAVSQAQNVQKFSIGGTIKNFFGGMFGGSSTSTNPSTISSSRSNVAGTSARPETKTSTVATSPFAKPGGTAKGRKAIQSVNYFGAFNTNTKNSERNAKMSEENTNKFEDIIKRLKTVIELGAKVKDDKDSTGNGGGGGGGDGGGGPGGDFTGTAADIPPEGKALLDAIAGAEAPGYNSRYPSKTFSNGYKDHPRLPEPTKDGRTSDAAGRYQFLSSTWDSYKPAKAFTPENQDVAAWRLAISAYGKGESGIVKDLQKDPMKVATSAGMLQQWPSLPGGNQKNDATSGFLNRYNSSVKKYKNLTTKPTKGSLGLVLPQGKPEYTSGFRTADRPDHYGIDIGVDAGSPVTAFESGKVVDIYPNFGKWGNAVVVEHKDKTRMVYGHVVQTVKVGDSIDEGQVIAKVKYWPPNTAGSGNRNNTHLHLERVVGGKNINPISYINNRSSQKEKQSSPANSKISPKSQSLIAPSPIKNDFGGLVAFSFIARDGKKYRVENIFGLGLKFFNEFGLVPMDMNGTNNKWLIDDYNKASERYQMQNQKPKETSLVSPKTREFEIASGSFDSDREIYIINKLIFQEINGA
jgi:murein DD-endopeptidase MepM/ murein hydrolase activator NlpD